MTRAMGETRDRLLAEPEIESCTEQGHTWHYVRLQRHKAVRGTQPDPDVLIYFYLDREGVPVGVKFHEPVSSAGLIRVLAAGLRSYLPRQPRVAERLVAAFEKAAAAMPEHLVGTA